MDDVNLVGPPDKIIPIYNYIEREAKKIGLHVESSKCKFLYFHGDTHPLSQSVTDFIQNKGFELKTDGAIILGAPVAKDERTMKLLLKQIIKSQTPLLQVLGSPYITLQETLLLARLCGLPSLNFLQRVVRPNVMTEVAKNFSHELLSVILQKLEIEISRASGADDFAWTKALEQLQLPVKAGGLGLIDLSKLSDIAYCSSLAHAIEFTSRRPNANAHSVAYRTGSTLSHALRLNFNLHYFLSETKLLIPMP